MTTFSLFSSIPESWRVEWGECLRRICLCSSGEYIGHSFLPLSSWQQTGQIRGTTLAIYGGIYKIQGTTLAIYGGIYKIQGTTLTIYKGIYSIWGTTLTIYKGIYSIWGTTLTIYKGIYSIWGTTLAIYKGIYRIWGTTLTIYYKDCQRNFTLELVRNFCFNIVYFETLDLDIKYGPF